MSTTQPVIKQQSPFVGLRRLGAIALVIMLAYGAYRSWQTSGSLTAAPAADIEPATAQVEPPLSVSIEAVKDGAPLTLTFAAISQGNQWQLTDADGDRFACPALPDSVEDLDDCTFTGTN